MVDDTITVNAEFPCCVLASDADVASRDVINTVVSSYNVSCVVVGNDIAPRCFESNVVVSFRVVRVIGISSDIVAGVAVAYSIVYTHLCTALPEGLKTIKSVAVSIQRNQPLVTSTNTNNIV